MHPFAPLAEILGQQTYDFMGLVGGAIMGVAAWVQWRLSWLCSDVEEEAKDAKITADQAQNRLRILRWLGPLLMVLGVGLLVFAGIAWLRHLPM